jgi:hypothetical protein
LLAQVPSQAARDYARLHGWQRVDQVRGRIALFERADRPLEQLIVPLDPTADYAQRIGDVVSRLAKAEARSPQAVLADLLSVGDDTLRISVASPLAAAGELPLDTALEFLAGARLSVLAAAHSVLSPRRHHPRLSRAEAETVVAACRLGQTERGSFTATIRCPLLPSPGEPEPVDAEPLPRRSLSLLLSSVTYLIAAIEGDRLEAALEEDQAPSISANLCEALLSMQAVDQDASITLAVTWSLRRPAPTPHPVVVRKEHVPALEQASRLLRPARSSARATFVARVDTLDGDPTDSGHPQGQVTLLTYHDGEPVRARVTLDVDDYATAGRAHMNGVYLQLEGLFRAGRRLHRIDDARAVRLMPVTEPA